MKRFAIIALTIGALVGAGVASAQARGGGSHGGGGGAWQGGGGSHGGGSWNGGGWHGGGSWNGGWHGGGSWNGGWHGGWGWHGGTNVVVGFGGPWWGWWPAYYPYYAYPAAYPYAYPYYGYGEYYAGPTYYSGTYVQRSDPGGQQQYQSGQVTSDGYSYYCPNPAGFYPQIPTCAAGWLRVVPQGAPAPTAPAQR